MQEELEGNAATIGRIADSDAGHFPLLSVFRFDPLLAQDVSYLVHRPGSGASTTIGIRGEPPYSY